LTYLFFVISQHARKEKSPLQFESQFLLLVVVVVYMTAEFTHDSMRVRIPAKRL
jgi:hypothetical protein